MKVISAEEARKTSERIKKANEDTAKRNALRKQKEEARRAAQQKIDEEKYLIGLYQDGIREALKKGNRSFKVSVRTLYERDGDLSIKQMITKHEDKTALQKIWRSLRSHGYKIEILKNAEHHSGCDLSENPGPDDPYWTYEYTAKVSW